MSGGDSVAGRREKGRKKRAALGVGAEGETHCLLTKQKAKKPVCMRDGEGGRRWRTRRKGGKGGGGEYKKRGKSVEEGGEKNRERACTQKEIAGIRIN